VDPARGQDRTPSPGRGSAQAQHPAHPEPPRAKRAFTTGNEPAISEWDLASGRQVRHFNEHVGGFRVLVSHDGKTLFTTDAHGDTWLWNADTGAAIAPYPGLGGPGDLARDDTRVSSIAADGSTYLWDAASGQALRHITGPFAGFTFAPDGKTLAAAGGATDGSFALLHADCHDTMRELCAPLPRDLSDVERTQYGFTASAPTCPAH
jgi:WD40 repeat protein